MQKILVNRKKKNSCHEFFLTARYGYVKLYFKVYFKKMKAIYSSFATSVHICEQTY